MRRGHVWILSASLLVATACKTELDDTPAADPLDDPWVDAIAPDEPETAVAIAPTDPTAVALAADPEPALAADPVAALAAGAVTPSGVVASPSNPSASKPASPGSDPAAVAPAVPTDPSAPVELNPAVAPDPVAPAAEPAAPAAPPPLTLADLHGDYRFVGGSAQRSNLEDAIEIAANQLPAAIRGIGRKRLTKTNPIDDNLEIVITGDSVQTIFETGFDAECVIDGATVHWTSKNNDKYKVRVRAKGSKLVQIIEGEDGVKTTVFVLSADRKKLTVHHKIDADRLDDDMTYSLSYSRK